MESTHYGVTLGHLDSSKLQLLLDEASASWRLLMESRWPWRVQEDTLW